MDLWCLKWSRDYELSLSANILALYKTPWSADIPQEMVFALNFLSSLTLLLHSIYLLIRYIHICNGN